MDYNERCAGAQRLGLFHGEQFRDEVVTDELREYPSFCLVQPWQDLLVEGRFAFHCVESVGQVSAQLLVIGYQFRFHQNKSFGISP